MKKMFTKTIAALALLAVIGLPGVATAALSVVDGELSGATDWLADVRFRNFQTEVSGDYEMLVNAASDRSITTGGPNVTGHVPNFAYNQAAWATYNNFWITYNPSANYMSLRLVGTGPQAGGATGGYDVTIGRAPDAVTAGPVNYINFQLWDRPTFPTFSGITISDLNGTNLGTFNIPAAGIGSWSILDPAGLTLNNGFVLQGNFNLDLTKLDGGKEGDKIIFATGNNPNAVPIPGAVWLLGSGLVGLAGVRKNMKRKGGNEPAIL